MNSERLVKNIERFSIRAGATMLTVGMLTGLYGCTESQVVDEPEMVVMTTDKPVDSPVPQITPTSKPTPEEIIFNQEIKKSNNSDQSDESDSINSEELFNSAPEIDGLNKEIQDDRVFWTYGENNIYGGEFGEYAGVYKENVSLNGIKVGGICLESRVCQKLLESTFNQIPEGDPQVKIVVPLDITKYDGDLKIEKITASDFDGYACFFDGNLNFIDVCPGINKYFTNPESYDGFLITDQGNPVYIRQNIINGSGFITDKQGNYYQMGQLFYYFSQGFLNYDSSYKSSFGKSICQIDSSLVIGLGKVVDNSSFEAAKMPDEAFLTIDGKIVFMESSTIPIAFEEN